MNVKVLIVDDEENFVELLAERLVSRGFHVTKALNGSDAVSITTAGDVDVVLLDVMMPGKDGIATLQEIKQIKPLTEAIMLTGHGTVETGIAGMKLGAYDYIMKPADIESLQKKLIDACKRKKEQENRIKQAEVDKIVSARGW
jgi:DNA-binding NtrC family response regulator